MITVRLSSRLGNQMFQYAAARALAERRGCKVNINISAFRHPRNWSKYQLWRFSPLKLFSLPLQFASNTIAALTAKQEQQTFVMEGLGYDPAVIGLGNNTFLSGYFTSERYFIDYSRLIRSLYDLAPFLSSDDVRTIGNYSGKRTPVSIHLRRGDYLCDALFNIGNLDHYYAKCIDEVRKICPDALFVVVSDDPIWCRNWSILRHVDAYVVASGRPALCDMALMASCAHHIIGNSTYAWWGAWLGANPDKRVFLPSRWLNKWTSSECGLSVPGWTEIEP